MKINFTMKESRIVTLETIQDGDFFTLFNKHTTRTIFRLYSASVQGTGEAKRLCWTDAEGVSRAWYIGQEPRKWELIPSEEEWKFTKKEKKDII